MVPTGIIEIVDMQGLHLRHSFRTVNGTLSTGRAAYVEDLVDCSMTIVSTLLWYMRRLCGQHWNS